MEFIRIINPSDVYVAVCSIYKISKQLTHLQFGHWGGEAMRTTTINKNIFE
jgi:hypothetical protein